MLRRNAALKVTALLLAVFLWFYVRLTQQNPFVDKPLPGLAVEVRDRPAGLALVGKPPTVDVVVRGPKGAVESAAAKVEAWVSLKGARAGSVTVPVELRVPEPLSRVRLRPQRLSLRLERRASKTLPVEVHVLGSVPSGYAAGQPRLGTAEVRISGLARDVERALQALVSVDVASARSGVTRRAEVRAVDAQGSAIPTLTIEPQRVQVTVPVTQVDVYGTVPVVLRTAGAVADGYRIAGARVRPAVVTIAGDAARIKAVSYVETQPLDLGGADGSISRPLGLVSPRGVKILDTPQVTAEIEIVEQ